MAAMPSVNWPSFGGNRMCLFMLELAPCSDDALYPAIH